MKEVLKALCVAAVVSLLGSCPPAALRLTVHVENNSTAGEIKQVVLGYVSGIYFVDVTENLLTEDLEPGHQKTIVIRISDAAGATGVAVRESGGISSHAVLVEEFAEGMLVNVVMEDGTSSGTTIEMSVEP